MNLTDYIADTTRRAELAASVGTSPDYLWQIATGWRDRKASHKLARAIETATSGAVTRHDLRPDIFGPVPELADAA